MKKRDPKFASTGLVEVGEELAAAKAPDKPDPDGLVGHWFLSGADPGWQGQILSSPESGFYLCQLYDWLQGAPSARKLVAFIDMHDWLFYPSDEEMRFAYEYGGVHERWQCHREEEKQD